VGTLNVESKRNSVSQTEQEIVEGIGSDYAIKYGFSNPDEAGDYFFKSGRGVSHEVVEAIAEHKNEPAWMRKARLLRAAAAGLGRGPQRYRLRQHLLLHQAHRESGGIVGGPACRHQRDVGQALREHEDLVKQYFGTIIPSG
jgi:hypothetical protein